MSKATYGPRERRCLRDWGQRQKKSAHDASCRIAVYLLRNPSPINTPVSNQPFKLLDGGNFTARQPVSIAAVQKKTDNGSTVISTEPAASMGVAVTMRSRKNPARALNARAKNRTTRRLRMAATTGAK